MRARVAKPDRNAYSLGALALFGAAAVILTALAYEYIGGYAPCPLCLQERYAYYAGIPVLFLSLVALTSGQNHSLAALGFGLAGLLFLANAGLGFYHAGVEWGFWEGPATCSGGLTPLGSPADLLKGKAAAVVRCDKPMWHLLGLSFAGWNAVLSTGLCAVCLLAARVTRTDAKLRTL